jgi:hypothetical protein
MGEGVIHVEVGVVETCRHMNLEEVDRGRVDAISVISQCRNAFRDLVVSPPIHDDYWTGHAMY